MIPPETTRVEIAYNDEYDQPYIGLADGDELGYDPDNRRVVADIDARAVKALEAAWAAANELTASLIESAGLDEVCLPPICEAWEGEPAVEHTSWVAYIAGSGSDDVWPIGDRKHAVRWFRDFDTAQDWNNSLPETVWISTVGAPLVAIDRARITVESETTPGYPSACHNCGHGAIEHQRETGDGR